MFYGKSEVYALSKLNQDTIVILSYPSSVNVIS